MPRFARPEIREKDITGLKYFDRLATLTTQCLRWNIANLAAAFLTGRYPFRNGMEERSHGNDVAGMLTDERTLAEALNEAGYFTAVIGKWHLGNWYKRHLPMQRGFDYQYHPIRWLPALVKARFRESNLPARIRWASSLSCCLPRSVQKSCLITTKAVLGYSGHR